MFTEAHKLETATEAARRDADREAMKATAAAAAAAAASAAANAATVAITAVASVASSSRVQARRGALSYEERPRGKASAFRERLKYLPTCAPAAALLSEQVAPDQTITMTGSA